MGVKAVSKLVYLFSILVFLFFVFLTIAGAFLSSTDPNICPLGGYIGIILPALIIINLFYIVYWGIRKKWWILLAIAAIMANHQYLTAMFQYNKDIEPKGETFKIATYNVHAFERQSTGYNVKQIVNFMQQEDVDIICLQEFTFNKHFNLDSLNQAFKKYTYKYIPILPNQGTRIAIYSKYPIQDSLFIPFAESDNCGMHADIRIKEKSIRLLNVHMQTTNLNSSRGQLAKEIKANNTEGEKKAFENLHRQIINNQRIRAEQAKQIHTHIEQSPLPVIVCGDFNDTPATYTYKEIKGKLKDGFMTCSKGYGYTFNGLFNLLRIDYIFHSPELKGIKYYSPFLKWSDHNPVIMEIEI